MPHRAHNSVVHFTPPYSARAVSLGWQCNSKSAVNAALSTTPDATDNTTSASSSGSKSGSQSFISRNVIAALAPTRLLPSTKAWFWQM